MMMAIINIMITSFVDYPRCICVDEYSRACVLMYVCVCMCAIFLLLSEINETKIKNILQYLRWNILSFFCFVFERKFAACLCTFAVYYVASILV